jgi:hypothetical protein
VATFSWSNSRQENPKTVREFLEKGRDLAECIPYTVIALSALGRCRCFLAVRSDKGERLFHPRREQKIEMAPALAGAICFGEVSYTE